MKNYFSKIYFFNKVIDKSELKKLITWSFRNFGIARASNMADKLKDLGFFYATKGGISLSLEDLRIPPTKQALLDVTFESISETDLRYDRGEITAVERFQKVIDTWNYASENLKEQVIKYFKDTDPLNSIYMMAFSGARANISQVRQLVGMRGLMSDPQGQIIDLPIFHNFREGLTITDYFISSYGARKGLVDTALRTADSGYLTRRLVDVAQDVIIREYDCQTTNGILLEEMIDNQKILITLQQALLGRVLAEDIIDFKQNSIIARANQSIDTNIIEKIVRLELRNILVRSPLTCSSLYSICQLCYGWNLAHGKLVDLGEAVGIIAAQSIGEPGTQLTMRTFHTGGVFTGELSQNLISDVEGVVEYSQDCSLTITRNRHGDNVNLVNNDCNIKVINSIGYNKKFSILKGSLILVSNNDYIKKGQIIAEYPLTNKLSTEKAKKSVVANYSGSVHFKNNSYKHIINSMLNEDLVVWVLSGEVYNLPNATTLLVQNNQLIPKDGLLASKQILSNHDGKVYILKDKMMFSRLLLVTSSKLYTNIKVSFDMNNDFKKYFIETDAGDKFILKSQPNKKILHQQVVGDLISNAYKTTSGGIIKYLDLSVSKNEEQQFYNIHGSGYILWIPEETHIINKDSSLLLVQNIYFIESGTEIFQNIFVNNSGFLEIVQKDGIIREIVVKPGQLHQISIDEYQSLSKYKGFLKPEEYILYRITTTKLVYWEYVTYTDKHFLLLRPVVIYSVPKKNLFLRFSENSFSTNQVNLKLVRRTLFKDGEKIKSVNGVNLISTHLIIEIRDNSPSIKCYMQFQLFNQLDKLSYSLIKFITADFLTIKDVFFNKSQNLYTQTSLLVNNGQYIKSKSVISETKIFSSIDARVAYVEETNSTNRRILLVGNLNTFTFKIPCEKYLKINLGDWVYAGDEIICNIFSPYSGKVISVKDDFVILRIGQPYLISRGSLIHINNNSLIQRGENIATLIFDRVKTVDIVQGLPRIEEILEARKKNDASFNPHSLLQSKFISCVNQGLDLYNATKLSLIEIQFLLVKEIQLVYQSQGVYISDKHIEVIVKQMTSKVKIENGGDTEYLPGELVDLQKIESINKSCILIGKRQASYYPILLGITRASLNTDSFISAASFQETTKVLTEAAIYGRLDWLKGLKENVIIGRLIPAGTGFNAYNSTKVHRDIYSKINNNYCTPSNSDQFKFLREQESFEDIIVDDRNN